MSTLTLTFVNAADGSTQNAPTGDGSGLVVTFASDGTAGVGEATLDGQTYTTELTVVDDGSISNLSAVVANESGAELFDDDGTTAFVQPESIAFTAPAAPAGQATTGVLSVS